MSTPSDPLRNAGLLTPQEAAYRLDVSIPTLNKMVREKKLPEPIRRSSRWVRYRAADIDAFIERLLRRQAAAKA